MLPILIVLAALFAPAATLFAQDATHSSGWVVIPVNEYGALRAKAFPMEPAPEGPPVDATLSRVDYELKIDGALAAGRANLTVDVLKDGWVRILIPSGLLVREAKLEGKPVALVPGAAGKGATQLSAVLSKRGRAVISLEIALPVAISSGEERLSLPASASGIARAAITLPRQGVDIKVTGGLLSEKSESATESKWLAYGRGNEPLTFTWRRKMEDHRVSLPLRLRGSLTELAGLGEESTSIQAEVNIEVLQGAAARVRIQIPDKVTVNQVPGATVADWEVKAGELLVTFLEPVERTASFVIIGEARLPRDGGIEIPLLRLLDAERESGGVAVEVLGAGEIKDLKTPGLEKADARDLGQMVASRQSPSLAAFRFRPGAQNVARSLTVDVARYTQQEVLTAAIVEARYRVLMSQEGKTLVQARYAVRNNQRNFVKIVLPPGSAVWNASMSGQAVRPGQAPDGSLLLPLPKASAGEEAPVFAVEIMVLSRGAAWNEKGRATLTLPAADLSISRTGLELYYPATFRVTPEPGTFRTAAYEAPSSVALTGAAPEGSVNARGLASPSQIPRQFDSGRDQEASKVLVDQFLAKSQSRRSEAPVLITLPFPAVGPSLFLVSELTSENQGPAVDLSYEKQKNGGAR